jgi:hypothetical protein
LQGLWSVEDGEWTSRTAFWRLKALCKERDLTTECRKDETERRAWGLCMAEIESTSAGLVHG